jgi:hypothetical protein
MSATKVDKNALRARMLAELEPAQR